MSGAITFGAGWICGAFTLALLVGAVIAWCDQRDAMERRLEAEAEAAQDEAGELYVPNEWFA